MTDEVMEKPASGRKALKKYSITFHSGEGKAEAEDVVIGHNCKLNRFQRDVETTIDENFLSVLKDAVIKTVVKGDDGVEREVTIPRFSYTLNPL